MRILFITATRLGDAVLATGLLDHLLQVHPDARVTVACGRVAEGVFQRMPGLERIIVVEKRRFDLHWVSLWWQVAGTVWDLVVDLRGSALSFLVHARRRAIMRGGRRPGHRLGHIAGALGLDPAPLPVVWTDDADRARAEVFLPPGGPIIGLGPTANWDGKIWPADRFVALFNALAARFPGARPAVFGGPGSMERAAAAPVLAALPGALDLVGRLSVPEAAACLARCVMFVGNDSGLMHLSPPRERRRWVCLARHPASEYAPSGRCTAVALADGPAGEAPMANLPVRVALLAAFDLLDRDGSFAVRAAQ